MPELGPASNDEMVLCFIRAEINSPKWGPLYQRKFKDLHFDRSSLIDNAIISVTDLQIVIEEWILWHGQRLRTQYSAV